MRNGFFFAILRGSIAIVAQNLISPSCIHSSSVHESKLESVEQTTQLILSIPEAERNFNNTLRVWNQLLTCLSYDCLAEDVRPDGVLQDVLTQIAIATLEDGESDFFQKRVASCFLTSSEQNFSGDFLYFQGKAEEQKSEGKKISLLNLSAKSFPDERTSDVIDELFVADSDIIYLREVFNFETAHRFFEGLKSNYAHFFLLADQEVGKNALIASKYPVESIRFYPLNDGDDSEGFFGFIIGNEQFSLGHVYAIQFAEDLYPLQFEKILEKIQRDMLERSEVIPVFLCGNLCAALKNPFAPSLLQEYFSVECSKDFNVFLLKPFPQFFGQLRHQEYSLISCSVSFLDCLSGTFFSVQVPSDDSSYSIFRNERTADWMFENDYMLLAGGGASVSASQDSKGNTTVEVEVKTSTTTDSGNTYSWSASGGVSRDERGDTSTEAKTEFRVNW